MRIDLILLAGVTISLEAVAQTSTKYEGAEFQPPRGWTVGQDENGMTLQPSGLAPGVIENVIIRPGEPVVGSFAGWWGAAVAAVQYGNAPLPAAGRQRAAIAADAGGDQIKPVVAQVAPPEAPPKSDGPQAQATTPPQVFLDPQNRFTVTVPPFWRATVSDSGTVELSRGNARVTIIKGSNGGIPQVQRLAQSLDFDKRGFREVQRIQTTLSGMPALSVTYAGLNAKNLEMTIKFVTSDNGWTLLEMLPSAQLDARKGGLSRIERTFRLSSGATVQPLSGVGYASATSPAARPNLPEGMLDGVYVGLRRGEIYGRIERDYLSFFPDGSVMRGMPQGGFDNFDPRTLHPNTVFGRYRAYGSTIEIIWNSSPNDRWSVQRDESATDVHGTAYIPTCRCDGATFSGVYMWGPYAIQFSTEGKFADHGVADSLHFFPDSTAFFERPRAGQGTYAIRNHTLYLNYGAGRMVRASFTAPAAQEKAQSFDWIAIQQINTLYRQGFRPQP